MIKLDDYKEAKLKRKRELVKQWRINNPERAKQIVDKSIAKAKAADPHHVRRKNLKNDFNLTLEEYNDMHSKQNGLCMICQQPETTMQRGKVVWLSVDHDHKTGAIRGLLCRSCNTGLGAFNDDTDKIKQAIKYLKEYKND